MKVVSINRKKQKQHDQPQSMNASDLISCHCPQCRGNILMPVVTLYEIPAGKDEGGQEVPPQLVQVPCFLCVNGQCGRTSQTHELLRITPEKRQELIEESQKALTNSQKHTKNQEMPNAG